MSGVVVPQLMVEHCLDFVETIRICFQNVNVKDCYYLFKCYLLFVFGDQNVRNWGIGLLVINSPPDNKIAITIF